MERAAHWNGVYTTKSARDVSWFETSPDVSLQMMEAAGVGPETAVLDVGGGDSRLVDALLDRGIHRVTVLDVSGAALDRAKARLGQRASIPIWIEADVTGSVPLPPMDIWHDRAVFHFLTDAADRASYVHRLHEVLNVGGTAIIATFALDGPERCSGLPVHRCSPETLSASLGPGLRLLASESHQHTTPWGTTQSFQYSRLLRE